MKIYFRLLDAQGGANILIDGVAKYLDRQNVECKVNYLPRFLCFLPFLGLFYLNEEEKFDLVHQDTFTAFFKSKKPSLFNYYHTVHDKTYYKNINFLQRIYYQFLYYYEKRALKNTNLVVCLSKFTKKELERVFDYRRAIVIPGGIETALFKPLKVRKEKFGLDKNKIVLLFIGNFLKRKGADLLPKIMKELGDDFVLLLITGTRKNVVGQKRNMIFLGGWPNKKLPEIYNLADIFLFPTRLEGFGFVVAEAMACGKPVVTTNCSAIPELIVDKKGGFLCEMDNVDDFVAKIKIIAADKKLKEKMGKFNRQRVLERFTFEQMGEKYLSLYKQLIKERNKGALDEKG